MALPLPPTGTMFTYSGSIPSGTTLVQNEIPFRKIKPFTPLLANQVIWSGTAFLHRWWIDAEVIAPPDDEFAPSFSTAVWGLHFGVTAEWTLGVYYYYTPLVWELVLQADEPAYWYVLLARSAWGDNELPEWWPFT